MIRYIRSIMSVRWPMEFKDSSSRIIDFDACPEEGQIANGIYLHPHRLPAIGLGSQIFITNRRNYGRKNKKNRPVSWFWRWF